jgi:uncharacterized phiE125 gp8 family phage protein
MVSVPILVTPPSTLPVSLAEFKAHARITHSDDDALIISYLRAAVDEIERFTGLALITQIWKQSWPDFTGAMILRRRPVQGIVSFGYYDSAYVNQPFGPSDYAVTNIGSDVIPSVLSLASSVSAPTLYGASEAVNATYRVGFGNDWNFVPELIRSEVMQITLDKYEFRGNLAGPAAGATTLQRTSRDRLWYWRPVAVA